MAFFSGELLSENRSGTQVARYDIIHYKKYVTVVNELYQIEVFKRTLEDMKSCCGDILNCNMSVIFPPKIDLFKKSLRDLLLKMQTVIDLGDSVGFSEIEQGFDIKMPSDLSLKEMSNCISDIDKALTQCPYLNVDGEKIEFKNIDVGSFWLEFLTICTGATIVLLNLSKIIDKATKIASHMKTVRYQTKQIEALSLKNEIAKSMVSGFNEMTDLLVEKCANELQDEINPLEPEDFERTKLTLNLLGDWISKGMEIHSCLEAPQEIKDLFPTSDEIKVLPKPTELIQSNE